MDNFITIDMLGDLAVCIAIVVGVTEALKYFWPTVNPKWFTLGVSVLVAVGRQVFWVNDVTLAGLFLMVLNLFVIMLGAIGLHQVVLKPIEKQHLPTYEEDDDE